MFTFDELLESSYVTVDVLKDDFKKTDILLDSPISRVDVVSLTSSVDIQSSTWVECEGHVADLMEETFLRDRVFKKDFDLVSSKGRNVFYLRSCKGKATWLTISMDLGTYERFGYRIGREDGTKRMLDIRMNRNDFLESKKYDRLKWCLRRVSPRLRCRLLCDEDTRKSLPTSFQTKELKTSRISRHFIERVSSLPDMEKIYNALYSSSSSPSENHEKQEISQCLHDWIGAVIHNLDDLVRHTGHTSPADGDRDAFVSKFRLFSELPQFCCVKKKDPGIIRTERRVGYMTFTQTSKLLSEQFECVTRENSFRVFSCWYDSTLPSMWRRKGRAISNQYMIPGQSACNTSLVVLPNHRALVFQVEPVD